MTTKLMMIFLLLLSTLMVSGQEVQIRSSVVGTTGINHQTNPVNISRWRLGQVYQIVLPVEKITRVAEPDWDVISYPNPTLNTVHLNFQTLESDEYTINLTDNTGKMVLMQTNRVVMPREVIPLDMSGFLSGVYLISITPKDGKSQKILKVSKI